MNRVGSCLLVALFACVLGVLPASAQCSGPFTITSSADSVSASCTNVSGSIWDLSVNVTHSGSTADLTIQVESVVSINDLVVTITKSGNPVPRLWLSLKGPVGGLYNLVNLANLELGGSNQGDLIVDELRMAGDLGYMECHGTVDAVIQGDVTGEIRAVHYESVTVNAVELASIQIQGDLLGDIIGDVKTELAELVVLGDIGTVSIPSVIWLDYEQSSLVA